MDMQVTGHTDPTTEEATLVARVPGEAPEHLTAGTASPALERRPDILKLRQRAGLLIGLGGAVVVALAGAVVILPRVGGMTVSQPAVATAEADKPLAPAAALAPVQLPPRKPAVRQPYDPKPGDAELKELQRLHPEGDGAGPIAGQSIAKPATTEPVSAPTDTTPPGSAPAQPAAPAIGEPGAPAAGGTVKAPLTAQAIPDPGVSTTQQAAREVRPSVTSRPPFEATTSGPPAEKPSPDPAEAAAGDTVDPAQIAANLRAAEMASAEQVQVLQLVTEIGALVRDLRTQIHQLRADDGRNIAVMSVRLGNFERRLSLAEARNAVTAARDLPEVPAMPALALPITPLSLTSVSATLSPRPSRTAAQGVSPPAPAPEVVKRYRLQAASPGLAMLAEVDRSGGEGAQVQVEVGDDLAGYGRVRAIGQKGTAWVVTTDRGQIQ